MNIRSFSGTVGLEGGQHCPPSPPLPSIHERRDGIGVWLMKEASCVLEMAGVCRGSRELECSVLFLSVFLHEVASRADRLCAVVEPVVWSGIKV